MDSSSVIIERNNSFAIIRFNGPETFNALSQGLIVASGDSFTNLERQPALRAIILTGAGDKAFCTGTDTTKLSEIPPTAAREISERAQALYSQIKNCAVPVIAAINGLATGAGFKLALACHLRIASANASFGFPETTYDSISEHAFEQLAHEVGHDCALEISRTGRTVSAEEALRIGLINRVAPEGQLLVEAESLARLISTMAPLAIRACLKAVMRGIELPLAEGLALETELFSSLFATDDVREGTAAFLEKRQPVFKGL